MSYDSPCNNCKFAKAISGTHHIECSALDEAPELKVKCAMLAMQTSKVGIYVDLNPHGVANGWALWPLNFDQIWVDRCMFQTEKE